MWNWMKDNKNGIKSNGRFMKERNEKAKSEP